MPSAPPALFRTEARALAWLLLAGTLLLAATPPGPAPPLQSAPLRVDLNQAPLGTLRALPGVGPATAARLVAARPLRSWAQVADVLGPTRLARLRPYLRLGPPTEPDRPSGVAPSERAPR